MAQSADAITKRAWTAGAAVSGMHLFLFPFAADHMVLAWFEVPILAILALGARMGRLPWLLPTAYLLVVLYHLFEPATGLGILPWAIPALLMFIVWKHPLSIPRLFLLGAWIGILASSGIYAWVWQAAVVFFEMSHASAFPVFLVVVLVGAILPALFLPLCAVLHRRLGWPVGLVGVLVYTVLDYWSPHGVSLNLALSMVHYPILLQTADIIGAVGATMFVALAAGLAVTGFEWLQRGHRKAAIGSFAAAAVVMFGHSVYGFVSMTAHAPPLEDDAAEVAMIQPMAPLKIRANEAELRAETASTNVELSRQAVRERSPDILFWPEGAGPFAPHTPTFNPEFMDAITEFHREHPVPIAVNCVEFTTDAETGRIRYYNAVVVIDPVWGPGRTYRKNILMPFGEYLPYERQLPFLRTWFPEARTVLAGEKSVPLDAPGGTFAPLICYEILFPAYVRQQATNDAGYIVNFTNDRWYGQRQQPRQHLAFAVLRAVENRLPVVRPTNSGISAIIHPNGVIEDGYRTDTGLEATLGGQVTTRGSASVYRLFGNPLHPFILTPLLLGLLLYVCLPGRVRGAASDSSGGNPAPPSPDPDKRRRVGRRARR